MDNELDIIDSLQALCYKGACLQKEVLSTALDDGINSNELRAVIFWLANELHVLRKTDEHISTSKENADFTFELSMLLTELSCPYRQFVNVPMSERFQTRDSLLQLLDYLISELMATKMLLKLAPTEPPSKKPKTEPLIQQVVAQLLTDLQLGELPNNINAKMLLDKVTPRLEQRLKQVNPALISEPLLRADKPLSDAQWRSLDNMHKELEDEYNLRRQMMLTRLEATVQSFHWSESMQRREDEIAKQFQSKLAELEQFRYGSGDTSIAALLAARADLAIIEKTSSANVRKNTASKIQKHVIGQVPDRGGRANEHAPPPPEMPSWQQQRASGPPRGGGGFGGRGSGGPGGGRGGGSERGNYSGGNNYGQKHNDGGNWHQQQQQQQQQFDFTQAGRVQGSGWNPHHQDGRRGEESGGGRGGGRGRGRNRGGGRGGNQRYQR